MLPWLTQSNLLDLKSPSFPVLVGMVMSSPRIAVLHKFLFDYECYNIQVAAEEKLVPSTVVNNATGEFYTMNERTSSTAHFQRGDSVMKAVEDRISLLTGIPVEHGEPTQIQRYEVGQEYRPHFDYFDPNQPGSQDCMRVGGQRILTVVIYLSDVDAGGETIFPSLNLSVKPMRGSAVLFENASMDGTVDPRTLHGGAPVIKGTKWIATKWIRQRPYI